MPGGVDATLSPAMGPVPRPLLLLSFWGGLAACLHTPSTTASPVHPTSLSVGDPTLNLGFEQPGAGLPAGWVGGPAVDGYTITTATDEVHAGTRSLRIDATPNGRFGAVSRRIDAAPLAGKQVVVHAWVKTEGVTGWAAPWIRVDGGEATYTIAYDEGPIGTTAGWTEVAVKALIPPGRDLHFGVGLGGEGTAWFDDVRVEVIDPPPVVPIHLAGRVTDPAGLGVAGAEVALIAPSGAVSQHVCTDSDGGYTFAAVSGVWGLSAWAPGRLDVAGGFRAQEVYSGNRTDLSIPLGTEPGVTLRGRLSGGAAPTGAYVQVARYSDFDADVFALPVAPDGRFSARLPGGDRYAVSMLSGGVGRVVATRSGDVVDLEFEAVVPLPAPPAVVDWITRNAIPLASVEPGTDPADLAALDALVGDARVVALGEATHGTREVSQIKHRILEHLVAERGFTVFALEIGAVEARTINAYVVDGRGTARAALSAAGYWIWETEEVLALVEWMRAWNRDPTHARKVQFVGYDMQDPIASFEAVQRYLEHVAPDEVAALMSPIEILHHRARRRGFVALSEPDQAAVLEAVAALGRRFDAARAPWVAVSGVSAFEVARHDVTILTQAATQFATRTPSTAGSELRDRDMAENIRWVLAHEPPGTRMVVWAHNMHVADIDQTPVRMGHHLRAALGTDLVSVGFVLGHGSYQALRTRDPAVPPNIEEIPLPPAPEGAVSATFGRTGLPLLALDLRRVPSDGPVAAWFRTPQLVYEAGYQVTSDVGIVSTPVLPALYDAVIYVEASERARPLAVDLSRSP